MVAASRDQSQIHQVEERPAATANCARLTQHAPARTALSPAGRMLCPLSCQAAYPPVLMHSTFQKAHSMDTLPYFSNLQTVQ
jgi:hypothetical protein